MSEQFETSESIVAAIYQGDRNAEEALVRKYGRALSYILGKRTGDSERAADLQQETFLVVIQKLRSKPLDDPSKLAAYLQSTAVNLFIGEIRKESRRKTSADSSLVEAMARSSEDSYQTLLRREAGAATRQLIEELKNDRDRQILKLYYLQDKDKLEICDELELSHRHFDRVISRARLRFKELIEDQVDDLSTEAIS
ncbi:MAG: sigma-70 family RNA polymerase sigma factor [Pseudomonadales bacterium]|nr:sigma-70 family RNA polymerase sigma factor [Pseudomonadales bacterium]